MGGVGRGGGWEVRGGLNRLLGLFGLGMGPRSASHRPGQTCLNGLKGVLLSLG